MLLYTALLLLAVCTTVKVFQVLRQFTGGGLPCKVYRVPPKAENKIA